MVTPQARIRIPVLFLAGFLYFVFRIYLHDWYIDTDAWGFIHYGQVLLQEGVFVADSNKLLVDLVGLIPAYLDCPILFPLITAVFGSAACLALYELILYLTGHRGYALAGWGIILLSPVLYWLVLACNSVVYATCFLMGSLYFFTREDSHKGSTFLVLAALSRPEPFVLIVFAAGHFFWQWKQKVLSNVKFSGLLIKLALPPMVWLAANFYKTGNVFYSFQLAQTYTKSTGQNYQGADFPRHLFELLSTYYFNYMALAFCTAGLLFCLKKIRRLRFIYGFLVLSTLGYWVLAPFDIPLLERYLLPIFFYLVIFAALIFNEVGSRWNPSFPPLNKKNSLAAILPVLFLTLFIHLPAHSVIERIIAFHKGFDQDIPKIADHLRWQLSEGGAKKLNVLASERRAAHLKYLLYEYHSRLSISSPRGIYFNKTSFLEEEVEWIVYAPNDLYPMDSAFYIFDLLSEEGLKKQGMHVGKTIKISENTQMLHLVR